MNKTMGVLGRQKERVPVKTKRLYQARLGERVNLNIN